MSQHLLSIGRLLRFIPIITVPLTTMLCLVEKFTFVMNRIPKLRLFAIQEVLEINRE